MTALVRRLLLAIATAAAVMSAAPASAQPPRITHRDLIATRAMRPPVIDGRLTDECWTTAQPAGDFIQQDPEEGKPASEHTEVRFVYDDDALYVGIRAFDSDVPHVVRRLSTRDSEAD